MSEVNPDPRVAFPDELAPIDANLARATFRLADAIARGDDDTLRGFLTASDRDVLDTLVQTGAWQQQTQPLEAVRVYELDEPSRTLTLALQDPEGAYLLAWAAEPAGQSYAFAGIEAPADFRRAATDYERGIVPERTITADDAFSASGPRVLSDVDMYVRVILVDTFYEGEHDNNFRRNNSFGSGAPSVSITLYDNEGGIPKTHPIADRMARVGRRSVSSAVTSIIRGQALVSEGKGEMSPEEIGRAVAWARDTLQTFGQDISNEQLLARVGTILSVDANSLNAVPVPEPTPKGPIRRNTPAGPVTIPGTGPG